MAYELKQAAELSQRIDLTGRERLTVTGVEDVERFDELSVVMRTAAGVLVVTGEDLHIGQLSLDGGELLVEGHIDGLNYDVAPVRKGSAAHRAPEPAPPLGDPPDRRGVCAGGFLGAAALHPVHRSGGAAALCAALRSPGRPPLPAAPGPVFSGRVAVLVGCGGADGPLAVPPGDTFFAFL